MVGASAGGVEALIGFVRGLPATLSCPVVVVLHVAPERRSLLPGILARATRLPVAAAADRDELRPGHVYVAMPDRHLLVGTGTCGCAAGGAGHRPALDPALRAAARAYGPRAVGVVLSGTRDDGTAGLASVKRAGGTALAQDPEEALHDGMPRSAVRHVDLDAVLPVAELGPWIAAHRLAEPGPAAVPAAAAGRRSTRPACRGGLFEAEQGARARARRPGR